MLNNINKVKMLAHISYYFIMIVGGICILIKVVSKDAKFSGYL
jgi:hypothetical protein